MKLVHKTAGIAAVTEGPRLETPAEVRMLAAGGAEVVTHTFVPEVFLAKELELVYRLRKVLSEMNMVESVELLKSRLAKCKTNAEFLMTMSMD